jgi:hypothetical protein
MFYPSVRVSFTPEQAFACDGPDLSLDENGNRYISISTMTREKAQ